MNGYLITGPAQLDLEEIWDYYALEAGDLELADRMNETFVKACRKLAAMPGIGHKRTDLADIDALFWNVNPFLIVYSIENRTVSILRVLHGSRDISFILNDDN
jgi:plasmid stabilization system protein ParE